MKLCNRLIFIVCASIFFLSFKCGIPIEIPEGPYIDRNESYNYLGDPVEYDFVNTTENSNLTYTLDLGTSAKDVYFIFTNISLSSSAAAPEVQSLLQNEKIAYNINTLAHSSNFIDDNEFLKKGSPEISEFNRVNHSTDSYSINMRNSFFQNSAPLFDTLEAENNFCYDYNPMTKQALMVTATCRKIITSPDGKKLNIWVANDDWDDTIPPATGKVNSSMIDTLGDIFLKSNPDTSKNDIYHWVTNIYGNEWGAHSYPNMIGTNNGELTILMFNIPTTGVAGYFYSKDNYSSLSYSNKRIMFYLDAAYFADETGGSAGWNVTDPMPSQIISTLAHEFQHMIHFYQKMILNNLQTNSDTWIDEMCSLVTEDLIAEKLAGKGPRGLNTASPGTPGIIDGRLSRYNRYNDTSVTGWQSTLEDYAAKYAFGAYLVRNYGGAPLFKRIVQNSYTNYYAVDTEIQAAKGDEFSVVLRNWGIANLLSDITYDVPFKYNNGGATWMETSIGVPPIIYKLGSINLYNYYNAPTIYNNSNLVTTNLNVTSNRYYKAGTAITGNQSWNIKLNKNTRLTVLIRD